MSAARKTERVRRTATEKAQQALDVATRAVERLQAKHASLMADAAAIMPELDAAAKRRDYLATSPDLPSETDDELPIGDDPDPDDAS